MTSIRLFLSQVFMHGFAVVLFSLAFLVPRFNCGIYKIMTFKYLVNLPLCCVWPRRCYSIHLPTHSRASSHWVHTSYPITDVSCPHRRVQLGSLHWHCNRSLHMIQLQFLQALPMAQLIQIYKYKSQEIKHLYTCFITE